MGLIRSAEHDVQIEPGQKSARIGGEVVPRVDSDSTRAKHAHAFDVQRYRDLGKSLGPGSARRNADRPVRRR
jgi:hypothetical protein